ncbi:DUF1778 domain-containing protein [Roseateles chitinivorans]|uniref:type II toxin -antitoxin system TacA 1-like antitoxin n=1 Tax=Roseateles chitinivorans TaxID=2917965 RepID=UPI003D67EAAD
MRIDAASWSMTLSRRDPLRHVNGTPDFCRDTRRLACFVAASAAAFQPFQTPRNFRIVTALNPDHGTYVPPAIATQIAPPQRAAPIESDKSVWLQIPTDLRDLIISAAESLNKTRAAFVHDAMRDAADDALLYKATQELTSEQLQACEDILERPLSENAAYQRMMARKPPWEL